ncbi:MAG: SH3 domain-containing protein [Chloroflexota bacterium]
MTKRRVQQAHKSDYPNPISFSAGDKLVLGRRDDEYWGWIWTTTPDGNAGWAPDALISIVSPDMGIALETYTAQELDTTVGELVIVLRTLNEWAWVENERGEQGWVPQSTLKVS